MSGVRRIHVPFRGRGRQFFRVFQVADVESIDQYLRQHADNCDQYRLLARLPAYDRAHHARVRGYLESEGYRDPDLLLAALLHDVGKADDRGKVRLVHRVGRVIARWVSPNLFRTAAMRSKGKPVVHGFFLAEFHAEIGAELATGCGASPGCCRLIAQHESSELADPLLQALIHADERVS